MCIGEVFEGIGVKNRYTVVYDRGLGRNELAASRRKRQTAEHLGVIYSTFLTPVDRRAMMDLDGVQNVCAHALHTDP